MPLSVAPLLSWLASAATAKSLPAAVDTLVETAACAALAPTASRMASDKVRLLVDAIMGSSLMFESRCALPARAAAVSSRKSPVLVKACQTHRKSCHEAAGSNV